MSARSSLPPALEPYLVVPPEASLIVLTSTLGCSVSWLVGRFVGNALTRYNLLNIDPKESGGNGSFSVLLVSWMSDEGFWKGEVRRGMGLDFTKPPHSSRFMFIDAFTHLPTFQETQASVISAATTLTQKDPSTQILLILDTPSILLATNPSVSATELNTFLLTLRSQPTIHSTILTLSADSPLICAANTPLESESAAFATTAVHSAQLVMSVRELGTGAAKDVSGVVRITRGGDWDQSEAVEENELLYFVGRDGSVKVFGRGSDR